MRRGLLARQRDGYRLSHDGSAQLAVLRPRVVERSRRLFEGLSSQDVEIALRVLDQVSARAVHELAALGR